MILKILRNSLPAVALHVASATTMFGVALAASGAAVAQQELTDTAELATVKATIQSVDAAQRKLTLQGADGRTRVVKVGPQVENFAQVKAGDVVEVAFYQSIATDIREPGKGQPSITTIDLAARAPKGALPAATMVEATVFTFEVVGIEPQNKDLILADSSGNLQTVQLLDAKSQALLPKIKLGDKYDIVVTDALAVAIQPAK